ncbi:hypothetical protein ABS768_04450 [Flavobacterium sp. ST-75]|uniref:Uncharacterized protein n=1 Tax=Flavobacterium rhizophilum TaxID=3163296 RepID=A0ABW8Y966_9FLAO
MFFVSCSQYDDPATTSSATLSTKSLTVKPEEIKSIHQNIKSYIGADVTEYHDAAFLETVEAELNKNIEFYNQQDLEALFVAKGVNVRYISQVQDMIALGSDELIYDYLLKNAETIDDTGALLLFYEMYNLALQGQIGSVQAQAARGITFDCALAIAGSAVATLAGAGVAVASATNPASAGFTATLGFWVVGKAIATVSLIRTCR